MPLRPAVLLGLGLWLAQLTVAQRGIHPLPSISSLLSLKIPRGQTVTFVCGGPAEVNTFRLEKQHNICSHTDQTRERHGHTDGRCERSQCVSSSCVRCNYEDKTAVPQPGPGETEAQFPIGAVSGDSAGCYRCLYRIDSQWSERSEPLELMVTPEDVSDRPPAPTSWSPSVGDQLHLGLAGAVLLVLVGILAEAWHSRRQDLREPQGRNVGGTQQTD